MKIHHRSVLATLALTACVALAEDRQAGELYPPIEPYKTGHLSVGDGHEVYYELCGNPQGKAVFVLHGGPGGGCYPSMRQYYDPQKWLIVLHDQRGAGRSRPYAELRANTTQHLVRDIEKLRELLELDKIYISGGSWGSTLGLAYAEAHPVRVSAMVLRGIFAGTKAETEHFYGAGTGKFFPDAVARVERELNLRGHLTPENVLSRLQSGDKATRQHLAIEWTWYEVTISLLQCDPARFDGLKDDPNVYAFALIENHYLAHDCFLEPNQLLRDARRLRDIPITFINGRYDVPCPPITAYRLHKLLPKSKLIIVEKAGHAQTGNGIGRALVEAFEAFE